MGRPSKLTEKQWEQIGKRIYDGETPAKLAKEFGVDRAAITRKFSQQVRNVKAVANQVLAAEENFRALPVAQQLTAISLIDQLRSISGHLAGAANYGAATAHRLAGIANAKVAEIDDSDPLSDTSLTTLKGIAALTNLANESGKIAVSLLNANKDTINDINKGDGDRGGLVVEIVRYGG
jgi:hypothetical protein